MHRFGVPCALAFLCVPATAFAQSHDEVSPPPTSLPAPSVTTTPTEISDHDKFVHHFAVGYFGTSLLPIAVPPGSTSLPPTGGTVTAPAIGIRYWFSRRLGLDAGFGLGFTSGSQTVNSASASTPSSFGLDVHAGLPIAVVSGSHYTFEMIPEALVGFTTGSIPGTTGAAGQSLSGFLLNLGGRIGAELHFGFIGVPQLALQGSVGVYFTHQSFAWSQGVSSGSVQSSTISTSVEASPWAIFTDNISALYYF